MRKSDFSNMELHFLAMLHSYLGNKNSDVGHMECSRGLQVPNLALLEVEQLLQGRKWEFVCTVQSHFVDFSQDHQPSILCNTLKQSVKYE